MFPANGTFRCTGELLARRPQGHRTAGAGVHDLRHTHVSRLIADGWDPVEVAARIGDALETTLRVYAHEFDARRRSEERRRVLEARYGEGGMATRRPQQSATNNPREEAETLDLQAKRSGPQ